MFIKTIKYYRDSFDGLSREVWILSLVQLINRTGMMVIPFLTLYATQELGYSVIKAGLLPASFGLGSLVGSWLGGWLSDRIGTYKVIVYSLFIGGLGLMGLGFITEFYALLVAIFIVSTIADALRPAIMSSITIYSKPENRTRSISLLRMAINLGISIGPAIGGIVAGTLGYMWLFLLDGGTCIIATLVFIFCLKEKNTGDSTDNSQERNLIEPTNEISVYRDYPFLFFLFVNLINIIAFFQILSTAPLFFEREMGLNEIQIGLFFTLNGLIIFLFEMPLIFLTEKIRGSMFWVMTGALMIGCSHLALNIPGPWYLAFLGYSLLVGFGEIFNFPYSNTMAMNRGTGSGLGKYMGLYTMMFSAAFLIAPIVGTRILDAFGFTILWYCMAFLNFVSIVGFIWVNKYFRIKQ